MCAAYKPLYIPAGPDTENKTPHQIIQEYKKRWNKIDRFQLFQLVLYEVLTAESGELMPDGEERGDIIYFVQYLWVVDQALDLLNPTNEG